MKTRLAAVVMFTAMLPLGAMLAADSLPPGQVDFGTFSPARAGAEFVEVNVPSSLISLAAKFIEKEEPDVAKMLNGLKLVRVNVVGIDESNRDEMQRRVEKVRSELSSSGWDRIVTAQKQDQDVGVFLKLDKNHAVQGLAVMALEASKQAVFVNVVGDIRPEQLASLGEKLNIDPLKKLGPAPKSEEAQK